MTRRKAIIIVFSLFLISVLVRLPNLNRPLSKHHEFMAALILINIESWRQAGGASKFDYVPLQNFQNPGDKFYENNPLFDQNGNQWYISLGPGWYIIPYFIFEIFHLPAEPIYLQIINLFFGLLTVLLLFYFLEQMLPSETKNKYPLIAFACAVSMFTPGLLWYFGNGYAHTGIMMPFVIGFLMLLIPMLESAKKINPLRMILLALMIVTLVYIDWLALFLCGIAGLYASTKIKKDKRFALLGAILFLSACLGAFLLFLQFSSYAGSEAVINYWKDRFFSRSFANHDASVPLMIGQLFIHSITLFLPLLILILIFWFWNRLKKQAPIFTERELIFLKLYTSSLVLYNLVFLEWSYAHEFSILPWSLLLAYIAAKLVNPIFLNLKTLFAIAGLFFAISIFQYYEINSPGKVSRDGMAYNSFKDFGEQLKNIPPDCTIFSPLASRAPMIEFYAGRSICRRLSLKEAKDYVEEKKLKKAVWVDQSNYQIKKIEFIK
ncbi:MAG: hypothetical protein JST58_07630 [Bacteroidetes bacterium]|nr:hypothetical protein [Bacteroidota bacterium]